MRALPFELAIMTLAGEFDHQFDPQTVLDEKQEALRYLRGFTEEDFGYDCEKWRAWFRNCSPEMYHLHNEEQVRKELIATRPQRLESAEERWKTTTERRCPHCGGLCPEYRAHCWVCRAEIGRLPCKSD
jgi:hypothetical protein